MQIGGCHLWRDGPIEGIARFQDNCIAWVDSEGGRNIRMPAIMPSMRFMAQRFAAVDTDDVASSSHGDLPCLQRYG
jgi:hypothetical protein